MNHDSPILLVLILVILNACSSGYYIRMNPNQGVVPLETGLPMPEGTFSVSAQISEIVGNDDYRYVSTYESETTTYRHNDRLVKPIGTRVAIRASYQNEPMGRLGIGLTHSIYDGEQTFASQPGERLTLFLESTRYWKLRDNGDHLSFYHMIGASFIAKRHYNLETDDLNHIGRSMISDYYMSVLLYHPIDEFTGFRWGLALPVSIMGPASARAGLTAGLAIHPSQTWRILAAVSMYSEAITVRAGSRWIGKFPIVYPLLGSIPSRKLTSAPFLDASIGFQFNL